MLRLTLTHDRTTRELDGGELRFGRTSDFVVGSDNQFVHRTMGRFLYRNDCWWVENHAQFVPLAVVSSDGTRVELSARNSTGGYSIAALVAPMFDVRFTAGGTTYEISGRLNVEADSTPEPTLRTGLGEATIHSILLTDEERQLVTALARPVLLDPSAGPDALPANRQVARELGWTDTKLNRKLDYLCHRLTKQGFQGLKGDLGGEAKLRRWRLVEYAVSHGLVHRSDLDSTGTAGDT